MSEPKNRYALAGVTTDWLLAHQLDLDKLLAYHENALLTGMTIKRDEEGWFVVIKATIDAKPMVHFTGARHYADIWELITYEVTHEQMTWKADKYA